MRDSRGVTLTDYRFTGQRRDGYIKLIDMGARRYDPMLGRFISADTIIPNPGNPLDLDRFAYVRNNPLKYTDPSGHYCMVTKNGRQICSDDDDWSVIPLTFDQLLYTYGITFTGNWSETEKRYVYNGVKAVGNAFVGQMRGVIDGAMAFKLVYGHMEFVRITEGPSWYGWTLDAHTIEFYGFYKAQYRNERLVVHELGHAFNHSYANLMGIGAWDEGSPYGDIGSMYALSRPKGDYGNRGTLRSNYMRAFMSKYLRKYESLCVSYDELVEK